MFILGLLTVSVALSQLPAGPWLYPLDALAVALLAAGAVRSARILGLGH
jgi:hypothetical protein